MPAAVCQRSFLYRVKKIALAERWPIEAVRCVENDFVRLSGPVCSLRSAEKDRDFWFIGNPGWM